MKNEGRRSPVVGWALMVTGSVMAVAGLAWRSSAQAPILDFGPQSQEAHVRIEQALAAEARALEPTAVQAARLPELVAALDMGADRTTFQDLLENEDWWAPYRSRFPLSAIIADGPPAVIGPGAGNLFESRVVQNARQHGVASGILPGNGRAFVAAAASATQAKGPMTPPVILLGAPLNGKTLKKISDVTGDAVGLSDGTKLIEAGGPGEPARTFAALVGRESSSPLALGTGHVGVAWPVGAGLWMLGAFAAPPLHPRSINQGLWLALGGAIIAAVGMAIAASRRVRPSQNGLDDGLGDGLGDQHNDADADALSMSPLDRDLSGPKKADSGEHLPSTVRSSSSPSPDLALEARGSPVQLAAYAMDPTPARPMRMGRYELIERIGEGGMAEIFFAAARGEEDFVRYFVVKRMHAQLARLREAVNQFTDEARLQAGLVHSNIVPVFDFGKAEGEYFLALEYIHGRDVGQVVERHVERFGYPLSMDVAFYIVHDVLEALSYAHSQTAKDGTPLDIVHRDVSPGNVLVSYRGEVKLTDFGIAKADKRVSRTEVGIVKGNASFMSPEQARGEPVDQRSDIFSAGLVLFYCLTGERLYRGETTLNLLLRAAVGPATSQFDHIDQLPLPAAKVLRHALALDPAKRYRSAADFGRDLAVHMVDRDKLAQLMDVLFPTTPAPRPALTGYPVAGRAVILNRTYRRCAPTDEAARPETRCRCGHGQRPAQRRHGR